ncbi:polysaccharide lyase [Longitalea luteola]|uniref:polysaccharide lyase n=1 Tax=Longitalea luteola TaxID=2812563 RepID=UPI001A973AD2|nr:polysaccharide lyase [Longitalea luteola]
MLYSLSPRLKLHSPILFQLDFEDNDPLPSFLIQQTATEHGLKIVERPVYNGKKAVRFELRDKDPETNNGTRSEILFPGPDKKDKLERWYAFAVYFPKEDFVADSSDEVISQWHQGGKATPSLCIRTKNNQLRLRINPRIKGKKVIEMGAIEKDVWQYYVIHVKHSPTADGLVEIWRNGMPVVHYKGANMYDLNSGDFHTPNWKLGIYKSSWNGESTTRSKKRVIYFDDIKVGNEDASYTDMMPKKGNKR